MTAEITLDSVPPIGLADYLLNARIQLINNCLQELQAARLQLMMTTDDDPRRRLSLQIQNIKGEIEKILSEMERRTGKTRDQLLLQLEAHHNIQLKNEGVLDPEPTDLELKVARLQDAARLVSQELKSAGCPLTPQQRDVLGI